MDRWITDKLEYKRIWTELEHVRVELASHWGSWSGGLGEYCDEGHLMLFWLFIKG